MGFVGKSIYQARVVVNEALRPLGVQVVNNAELDALQSFKTAALASMMRLPDVFVETGTYRGDTTAGAAALFREVHTIELSRELYERARERFKDTENVTCHHGDSAKVLRALAPTINEPAVFYLDAHWAGGNTARGEVEAPLLEEIDSIMARSQKDVVVIDDLRLIGKSGKTGLALSREYPLSDFDWRHVSMEAILDRLGRPNAPTN
jgi:hypothetical protein